MADRVYTAGRGASAIAWIALIVALIALTLGWIAYNRTGADLEDQIQTQVQQAVDNSDEAVEDASNAVDAGPDGVDEDDTDVNTTNQ